MSVGRAMSAAANGAVYGAGAIKRRRRTGAQVDQLERQILEILEEDHPQSVRHVFYRLTNPRLPEPVAKTELGYRVVQNRLTVMRREGKVSYGWISDATRRGHFTNTYLTGADFLTRHIGLYRQDLWFNADVRCEVWCESRSIAGVIVDTCRDLAVDLYPCGGFSSITFAYEAAQSIRDEGSRPVEVIYIGDYDPAGVLIDRSLEAELRHHLRGDDLTRQELRAAAEAGCYPDRVRPIELRFTRLAITPEQIVEHDLPAKPRKEGDRRARHVKETVEAEAMPAGILRQLLRDTIESFLPPDALAVAKAAEESERAQLRRWAELMREASP
jgi:hypothetical protein